MITIFRYRDFSLLWFGQLVSTIGDWVIWIALAYYIYQLTGSTLATGASFLTSVLPGIVLGPIAGVFVDRWDRKRTLWMINLLQALLLSPLLLVHSSQQVCIIYIFNFLGSMCSVFANPAKGALIPLLVHEQDLLAANGLNGIGSNLPRLVGPVLGGVLLSLPGGFATAVLVDAATFLFAAFMFFLMAAPPTTRASRLSHISTSVESAFMKLGKECLEGLHVVKTQRLLLMLFFVIGCTALADGPSTVLLAPFVTRILHSDAIGMGWLMTARGVGGILGGVVVGLLLNKAVRPWLLLGLGVSISGVFFLVLVNLPHLILALICFIGVEVCIMLGGAGTQTLLQQYSIDEYRGRIFSLYFTTLETCNFMGLLLVSLSTDKIGIIPWLNVTGLLYLSAGLLALGTQSLGRKHRRIERKV